LEGHDGPIASLAYSPDGRRLATACEDSAVRLWEVATGRQTRVFEEQWGMADAVSFSPGGKTIAFACHYGFVCLADVGTGKVTRLCGEEKPTRGTAFSPDGTRLASAGLDGVVRVWDTSTGRLCRTCEAGHGDIFAVVYSPDGRTLAWGGGWKGTAPAPHVCLWDSVAGGRPRDLPGVEWQVHALAYSPDGKLLAGGNEGGAVRLWDAVTGQPARTLAAGEKPVTAVAWSPDGKLLASGDNGGVVRLWEVASGEQILGRILHGGDGKLSPRWVPVPAVGWSPDGRCLATGGRDRQVLVWDLFGLILAGRPAVGQGVLDRNALWEDLASPDAARAYGAAALLVKDPEAGAELLRERLRLVAPAAPDRLGRLIADLDADAFATRQQAEAELASLGPLAEPALRAKLATRPPPEVRRRLLHLLEGLQQSKASPERLREMRGVLVLEHCGTAAARKALEALARGAPAAPLTQDARAALERLGRAHAPAP
jgi:WD40 repeat protein